MKRLHGLVAMLLALVTLACGGGSKGPDQPLNQRLSVSLLAPGRISASVLRGEALPTQVLSGKLSGALDQLPGKTLHVGIRGGEGLFDGTTSVSFVPTGPDQGAIALTGKVLTQPGRLMGTLQVDISLDAEGKLPLVNSPLTVPFDVTVVDGYSLPQKTFQIESTFGDDEVVQTVQANLHPGTQTWTAQVVSKYPNMNAVTVDATNNMVDIAAKSFTFRARPMAPGTYTETIHTIATVELPSPSGLGRITRFFEEDITITYVVKPNDAVDAVFYPRQLKVTKKQGENTMVQFHHWLVVNQGVQAAGLETVDYLTFPTGASSHVMAKAWLDLFYASVYTCYNETAKDPVCLPVGTYTARIAANVSRNGVQKTIYLPVTLEVVP